MDFEYYLAYIDRKSYITDKLEFYKAGDLLYRTMETLKVQQIRSEENGSFCHLSYGGQVPGIQP